MYNTNQITQIHTTRKLIEDTRWNAMFLGCLLSVREKDFLRCLDELANRSTFSGISEKQHTWLTAISDKLNVAVARRSAKFAKMRQSYVATCMAYG